MTKPPRKPTAGTRHGNGRGHGGPSRGASKAPASIQTAPQFEPGTSPNPGGKVVSYRTLTREQRLEAIREAQWEDAFNDKLTPRDRQAARIDLQDRLGGRPVQQTVNMTKDEFSALSDAELAAEQARLDGAIAADQAGDVAAPVPAKSGRLVH